LIALQVKKQTASRAHHQSFAIPDTKIMSHTQISIDIAINSSRGIGYIYGLAIPTNPGHEKTRSRINRMTSHKAALCREKARRADRLRQRWVSLPA
jgi:hypothetical protein